LLAASIFASQIKSHALVLVNLVPTFLLFSFRQTQSQNEFTSYVFVFVLYKHVLFKREHRMHRSSKHEGTRKGTLARTGGQKGGMLGESTGPVDYIPSDAPLGGN
jgi:hypothetical protein